MTAAETMMMAPAEVLFGFLFSHLTRQGKYHCPDHHPHSPRNVSRQGKAAFFVLRHILKSNGQAATRPEAVVVAAHE